MNTQMINRLVVLVHPLVWQAGSGREDFAYRYQDYLDYEKIIKDRWWRGIAEMADRPDEILFIGASAPPADLADHAVSCLGDRALIMQDSLACSGGFRDDQVNDATKADLGRDLLAMFRKYGFSWKSEEIGQPVVCRMWADEFNRLIRERGMTFDPHTLRAEGWGESFEGCVANYTRHLGTYLGLSNPIENVFEMTVPDYRILHGARFLGRIPLDMHVRLYLWETTTGRQIAWYHKAMASVGNPLLSAQFPLRDMRVEVRSYGELLWPSANETACELDGGHLTVPFHGMGRPISGTHFILAHGAEADEFRAVMAGAELKEG
jgi:hypothetical protein